MLMVTSEAGEPDEGRGDVIPRPDPRSPTADLGRRTLAVLTALTNGDGRHGDRLEPFVITAAARTYGGEVIGETATAVVATFTSTVDAIACAVGVERLAARAARPVRVGVAVGDVQVGRGTWAGPALDRAELLATRAGPGAILIDGPVQRFTCRFRPELIDALTPAASGPDAWELAWQTSLMTVPLPVELMVASQPAFVGRVAECERLQAVWEEARSGTRALALVSGEPGIGKTRLIAQLARQVHDDGGTVLYGRCDEDPTVSFQPFAEALGAYVAARPATHLWLDVGPQLAELTRLVPALGNVVTVAHPSGATHRVTASLDDESRSLLFGAVDALLNAAAASGPVLLILDDLHWADRSTLLLLSHLVQGGADRPLLVLGAYRDTDLDERLPVTPMLTALRNRAAAYLPLTGLAARDIVGLVTARTGREATDEDRDFAARLAAETAGNPLFVGEFLRHQAEFDEDAAIPEVLTDMIGRRLSHLSATTTRYLRAAAVVGREFDVEFVTRLPDWSDHADDARVAIHEAELAGILRPDPDRAGRYCFVHALVRQTLYDELSGVRRARAHRQVAEMLATLLPERPELMGTLALHARRAASTGMAREAAGYARQAADAASRRRAFDEAAQYLQGGIEALALSNDGDDDELRCDLLLDLAGARRAAGDQAAARQMSLEAATAARAIATAAAGTRTTLLARAVVRYGVDDAQLGAVDSTLLSLADEALARLGPDDCTLAAQVLAAQALTLAHGGQRTRADELSARALELAEAAEDDAVLTDAVLARYASVAGIADGARQQLALVDRYAHRAGVRRTSMHIRGWPLLVLGDRTGFDASVAYLARLAATRPTPHVESILHIRRAVQSFLDGRLDDADAHATLAIERAEGRGFTTHSWAAQVAWRAFERGDQASVIEPLRVAAERHPGLPAYRAGLVLGLVTLGLVEDANTALAPLAAGEFAALVDDWTYTAQLVMLLESCVRLGQRERTEQLADRLLPYRGQLAVIAEAVGVGAVDRFLGMAAAMLGRARDAEDHFEAAVAFETGIDAAPLRARSEYWLATTLAHGRSRGRLERAHTLATTASTTAALLGLTQLAREASVLAAAVREKS